MIDRAMVRRNQQVLLQMTDEDLMIQFQQGVIDAFEILVRRYRERLLNYVYRYVSDREICEDILQETFLRVYRNRHSYRHIAKYSTWLYTIAGNLALSEYRKRKRHPLASLQSLGPRDETQEPDIPDETSTPERNAENAMNDAYLQEALGRVPEDFREAVVLCDVQELTYEEIADITGLPMGTVKSRINRGRMKLRELLRDVY